MDSIYRWCCNVVTEVVTGKSLISLKTNSLSKNMLYVCSSSYYFKSFPFFPFFFFLKSKKLSKTVQFHLIVYKIFHFDIQLTANIEHKPKTNMRRQVWILKLKGLLFDPRQAEFRTSRHPMQSNQTNASKAKVSLQGKQDLRLIPWAAWHRRFSQDLFSSSSVKFTDANACTKQTDWTAVPLTQACWWSQGKLKKKTNQPGYFSTLHHSTVNGWSGSEVFRLILITSI